MCDIYSKLTTATPELRHRCVFVVGFEQISHCFEISIAEFQLVNAGWGMCK